MTPRPPVQSKSKKRVLAERLQRKIADANAAELRRVTEKRRTEEDRKRTEAATAARRRKAEERKKLELTRHQRGALAIAFSWVKDWSPQDPELCHLETEAGHVTFEHLAELAEAFKTRDINVVGQIDGGWYVEDATATVMIALRSPMLIERIRLFADIAELKEGSVPA